MSAASMPARASASRHRQPRAEAFGMRRRHVVRVAGFAVAAQRQAGAAPSSRVRAARNRRPRRATGRRASASNGRHGCLRHQLQRVEAEQHAAAQRIDAADERRVGQPGLDQARGLREHLRARRARGRDGHARPAQPGGVLHEIAERMRRVHDRALQVGREGGPGVGRFEARIGFFGRADARGRRADDDGDAVGAVALARGAHRVEHPVLLQRQPGEPVVAAFPARRAPRAALRISRPSTRPIQQSSAVVAAEVVATQAAAAFAQRIQLRVAPAAERGGRGVVHGSPAAASGRAARGRYAGSTSDGRGEHSQRLRGGQTWRRRRGTRSDSHAADRARSCRPQRT